MTPVVTKCVWHLAFEAPTTYNGHDKLTYEVYSLREDTRRHLELARRNGYRLVKRERLTLERYREILDEITKHH